MNAKLGRGMRRIVVDGQQYVWKFKQGNEQRPDTFHVFAAHHRTSPLSILFPGLSYSARIGGYFVAGNPLGGLCIAGHPEAWDCNLYTPVWAATLIRYGLANGWRAQTANAPLSMDGADVLTALDFKPTG